MPKTIIKLDASALIQSACMLRLKRIIIDGYTDKLPYNDLMYGKAFHKFVALMAMDENKFGDNIHEALKVLSEPMQIRDRKGHLNQEHLIKTCTDFWIWYKDKVQSSILVINGKAAVEIDFAIPYYEDDNFIVLLVGTIDKIEKISSGIFIIGDYKTHSLWSSATKNGSTSYRDNEIKEFFKKFELSTQLHFYLFCLLLELRKNHGSPLAQLIGTSPIGVCIDGVFLNSKEPTIFKRSDIWIPKEDRIREFRLLLDDKIKTFIDAQKASSVQGSHRTFIKEGLINGACNDGKFQCRFYNACAAQDDIAEQMVLQYDFIKREYDPLQFSK